MTAPARRFLVLAMVLAIAFAVAIHMVAAYFLADGLNWAVSIVTAVVVGGFLALILLGPRVPKAEGFTVEDQRTLEETSIDPQGSGNGLDGLDGATERVAENGSQAAPVDDEDADGAEREVE